MRDRFAWAGDQRIDTGQQLDGRHFLTIHHGAKSGRPFLGGAVAFGSEKGGGLGEATADSELALRSAKPGIEVGAIGFEGKHCCEVCRMTARGQDEDRRFADLRALGYLAGWLGGL